MVSPAPPLKRHFITLIESLLAAFRFHDPRRGSRGGSVVGCLDPLLQHLRRTSRRTIIAATATGPRGLLATTTPIRSPAPAGRRALLNRPPDNLSRRIWRFTGWIMQISTCNVSPVDRTCVCWWIWTGCMWRACKQRRYNFHPNSEYIGDGHALQFDPAVIEFELSARALWALQILKLGSVEVNREVRRGNRVCLQIDGIGMTELTIGLTRGMFGKETEVQATCTNTSRDYVYSGTKFYQTNPLLF